MSNIIVIEKRFSLALGNANSLTVTVICEKRKRKKYE